jgi:hypothetical protein
MKRAQVILARTKAHLQKQLAIITKTVMRAGSTIYYEKRIAQLAVDQIRYAKELKVLKADEVIENLKFYKFVPESVV